MNTVTTPMYEWNTLPWRSIERVVFKLQKRIYQAATRGDRATVHRLQRLLMSSWSAKCLAVRRVTQENQGKKAAGVDGVKSLSPSQRLHLVEHLHIEMPVAPARRVWIPKPNNPLEQRPLGIPTLANRAAQMLAKLALEPEWEAPFEPNSYGFRPGRSAHDALQAIFISINQKPKYVLDADIAKCFDRINHAALLTKLHTFARFRRTINRWLKAGIIDHGVWFPTEEGSPQGGIVSPLLANIALHGLEEALMAAVPSLHQGERWKPTVVRYADDFVVLHPDKATIEYLQHVATNWLAPMGLELKPSKTHVTHTLQPCDGQVGFDFLGVHIRQFPVGQTHSGKDARGHLLRFKTIITPSDQAMKRHQTKLKEIVTAHLAVSPAALIRHLNAVMVGWARYYAAMCSKAAYTQMDTYLFGLLWHWGRRRHPTKSARWRAEKYWHPSQGSWCFSAESTSLKHYRATPIRRHVKVQGTRSPYDGNWVYWTKRQGTHPDTPLKAATLLKWQQGKCRVCGLYFRDGDTIEVDHRLPKSLGGSDLYINLQLLHRHCHDQKTTRDGSYAGNGADDNSQILEEPDEVLSLMSGFEAERRG